MDGGDWQLEVDGRRKWPGGERLSGNIDLHAISDSIFVYMCYGICKLEKAVLFSKKRSIGLQRAVYGAGHLKITTL
jgi:hypothetical protein